jgi:hypothetical protein
MPLERLRVNAPHVINEVIDGEAVIINLATGDYFSLRGSGAFVWSAIERGAGTEEIVDAFVAGGADRAEVATAVGALVTELDREGLIVSDGPAEAVGLDAPAGAFVAPRLEKFTDMKDLILLDPVHEVGEGGWPLRGT